MDRADRALAAAAPVEAAVVQHRVRAAVLAVLAVSELRALVAVRALLEAVLDLLLLLAKAPLL